MDVLALAADTVLADPGASTRPPAGTIYHTIGTIGTFALLFLTLAIDLFSIFPPAFRNRLIAFFGTAAIYEGFNGSAVDRLTVGALEQVIAQALEFGRSQDVKLAAAATSFVAGLCLMVLWVYFVGCILPKAKFMQKFLGPFPTLTFPNSGLMRLNGPLWLMCALMAILADLPQGNLGRLSGWLVDTFIQTAGPTAGWLTGGL